MAGLSVSSVGHDPPALRAGQTGLWSCNRIWNVSFVFVWSDINAGKFHHLHLEMQIITNLKNVG